MERLVFFFWKVSLMEKGYPTAVRFGALRARSRPFSFATIARYSRPSGAGRASSTASASRIWGTHLGETKLVRSRWRNPASRRSLRKATFSAVGMKVLNPCQASRGHSTQRTSATAHLLQTWNTPTRISGGSASNAQASRARMRRARVSWGKMISSTQSRAAA